MTFTITLPHPAMLYVWIPNVLGAPLSLFFLYILFSKIIIFIIFLLLLYYFFRFLMTPLTATSTRVQIISNTDPKMAYVPYWLLNLVTKHLAHMSFSMLRAQAASCTQLGSPYLARINSNPIYQDLIEILRKYQSGKIHSN
jgi:hypothetical protein